MSGLAIHGGRPASGHWIPSARPRVGAEAIRRVSEVLESGMLRSGAVTEELEKRFAELVGVRHAYAVCNGTAALHCAYASILDRGAKVLIPDFTFIATASAAIHAGAKPVLVDIDPSTLTIDVEDAEEKAPGAKAIAPVHLFGNPCDMDAVEEISRDHGLRIVSDCAQAHGSRYRGVDVGSLGDLACYSLYATKTLTTGEGGMVATDDQDLYRLGLLLRNHGEEGRHMHRILGFNYRMTDVAAAIGVAQIKGFRDLVKRRVKNAEALRRRLESLEAVELQRVTPRGEHSYSLFTVLLRLDRVKCTRDEFATAIQAENIECSIHYPEPLHRQPALVGLGDDVGFPSALEVSRRVLSLPMSPTLSEAEMESIASAVEKVSAHFCR